MKTFAFILCLLTGTFAVASVETQTLSASQAATFLAFVQMTDPGCRLTNDFNPNTADKVITFELTAQEASHQALVAPTEPLTYAVDSETGAGQITGNGLVVQFQNWNELTLLRLGDLACAPRH